MISQVAQSFAAWAVLHGALSHAVSSPVAHNVLAGVSGMVVSALVCADAKRVYAARRIFPMAPSRAVRWSAAVALGFMAHDTAYIFSKPARNRLDAQMLVHHAASAVTWPYALSTQSGTAMVVYCLWTEASNAFVNLRWVWAHVGLKGHWSYVPVGLAMVAAFFAVRVATIPVVLRKIWEDGAGGLTRFQRCLLLASVAVQAGLNLAWFRTMVSGGAAHFAGRKYDIA